ncbi:MAG: tRNA epoxyqueuosine(34) reductase QueG [Bacteroidaceae bacterium]
MNQSELTLYVKQTAQSLGFDYFGIAKGEPVETVHALEFKQWIATGKHGEMSYLENNLEKRLNPCLLVPECKSILCVAMNYAPLEKIASDSYQLSYYAYGQDYHDIVKQRLSTLLKIITEKFVQEGLRKELTKGSEKEHLQALLDTSKICVDTVPILERYWAQQAGLGWVGKSGQLIIPKAGTYFFLGEIILPVTLDYDKPAINKCGKCSRCVTACPTQALLGDGMMDCRKCLSYLTIEYRGDQLIDPKSNALLPISQAMNNNIYGCDICSQVCPWNRFAQPTQIEAFKPRPELLAMTKQDWKTLTVLQYQQLFKESAVKRAKYSGLVRNIKTVSAKEKKF